MFLPTSCYSIPLPTFDPELNECVHSRIFIVVMFHLANHITGFPHARNARLALFSIRVRFRSKRALRSLCQALKRVQDDRKAKEAKSL